MTPQPEVEEHMALTKCPECSGDVSDKAAACPHCGYPFVPTAKDPRSALVIERTGKGWKAVRALGWLLILVGLAVLMEKRAANDFRGVALGWWIGGAGVACLVTSKAGAWWCHG